jgi:hypothetical protein
MVGTDLAGLAAKLIHLGHDPDLVRGRLGITPAEWSSMRNRDAALDDALRGREARLADELQTGLARQARDDPKAALAYAKYLDARRLGEARRRAILAEPGADESYERRAEDRFRRVMRSLTPREMSHFEWVYKKVKAGEPFDPDDERVAALVYRRLLEEDLRDAGG